MREDKVMCQCCGKLMVPSVIRSRGVFVGWEWGWRIGGGHPVSSACPFCLSEDWDGVVRVRRGVLFKTVGLALAVIAFFVSFAVVAVLAALFGLSELIKPYTLVVIGLCLFTAFRFYKWFVN